MNFFELAEKRRSIGKVTDRPVPQALIERLLHTAIQAPNHHLTQPWRFFILQGEARERLGVCMAEAARQRADAAEKEEAYFRREAEKPLRAPLLITVASVSDRDDPLRIHEDQLATAAAVENLLLAATEAGLAVQWRTGKPAYDDHVKAFFGLRPQDSIIAFLYIGYAAIDPPPKTRIPWQEVTFIPNTHGWESLPPSYTPAP